MSVKVTGTEEFELRIRGLKGELASAQRAAMHRAVVTLRDEARREIHSPEGRAARGLRYELRGTGDSLQGIVKARTAAAVFSQKGREPGKMPPVRRIRAWLRRRGTERSRASAFLVARAIGRKGMKGHPVMESTLDAKRAVVVAMFREVVQRVLRKG